MSNKTGHRVPKEMKADILRRVKEEGVSVAQAAKDHGLGANRKRTKRVMRLFGVRPYRRKGKRYRKSKATRAYPNLLLTVAPSYANHVWVADFTEMIQHGKKVYVATIIDLFTRQTMGVHVGTRKGSALTIQALANALFHHPRPTIFHSDNGREYDAKAFIALLEMWGITISRSRPGCPWENGYQESFYGKFKVDFGDPNRFSTLGEFVAAIYRTIWEYNHTRIHSALKMPPSVFAEKMTS
ncbi:IS3 family transposase [Patescibacteria group bacterium]|nr:IS3 family transposase [Patescibacteria group bacterium]